MTPLQIKSKILDSLKYCPQDWIPTPGEKGLCTSMLNSVLRHGLPSTQNPDTHRQNLLAFVFKEHLNYKGLQLSSKALPAECWWAVLQWIKPYKDEDTHEWWCSVTFIRECDELTQVVQAWLKERLAMVGGDEDHNDA